MALPTQGTSQTTNTAGTGISGLAVKRGVTFAMLYLIIVGFGIFSLLQLKLDLFPDLQFPTVAVVNSYTGVNPEEIETLITRPMEMALASVKNVKKIRSTSKQGNSLIIVDLAWGTDIDQAMMDMREKIDIFRKRLPEEARQPLLFAFDPSLQPILLFSISGNSDPTALRTLVEQRLGPLIERIPGVASAQVQGGQQREIQVQVNPRKLRSYGISVQQVIQALRADNIQVASGRLEQSKREVALRTIGTFQGIKQIRNVVVGVKGKPVPQPVYLHQVAKLLDTHKEKSRQIQADGKPGMTMLIQKRSDANTVQTARRVLAALPRLQRQLPEGTSLNVMFDQSDFITRSLSNLTSSAGQAFFLAVLVLLFFLRSVRSSLIIAISIPISVIVTFSVMYAFNLTLNIISMAGLALAVGMLVDNSIVVLENVYRRYEEGEDPRSAAIHGSKEVVLAITASTLTTLAVFVPVLFVPGLAGMLFRDMVVTICFSLTASLLVAITLIPLMASRLLQPHEDRDPRPPNFIFRGIGHALDWLDGIYTGVLKRALHYRKTTLFLGVLSFIVAVGLGRYISTEFLPKDDDSMIMINYERSPGTSLQETMRTARQIETVTRRLYNKAIDNVVIEAGIGEGFIALFGKGSYAGLVRIRLKPMAKRGELRKWHIEDGLRKAFLQIPGLKFKMQNGAGALGGDGDIELQLLGYDIEKARKLSEDLRRKISKLKGTTDVSTTLEQGQPELQIRLKRDRLSRLGLNAATVGATISTAFKGTVATLYRERGDEFNVMVRMERRFRRNLDDIKKLYVMTPLGKPVELHTIATLQYALSPVQIERQDQQRMARVIVNVERAMLGNVIDQMRNLLKNYPMPEGFTYKIGGQAEDFIASFQWLGLALLLSIFLVYMVMASQFESLFEPFVIIFSIPLSLIGVFVILLITNTPLSVMALVGIVMLVGIVVNNAIVLIDTIKSLRQEQGVPLLDATLQAGRTRLRPILMTATTTIFGMVPLALGIGEGAQNWAGLGRVVIGGLISSTLLTLVVVPTLYMSLTTFAEKRKAKKQRKRAERRARRQAEAAQSS